MFFLQIYMTFSTVVILNNDNFVTEMFHFGYKVDTKWFIF